MCMYMSNCIDFDLRYQVKKKNKQKWLKPIGGLDRLSYVFQMEQGFIGLNFNGLRVGFMGHALQYSGSSKMQ